MKRTKLTVYLSIFISLVILGISTSAQNTNPKPVTINFKDLIGKWKANRIAAYNFFLPPAPKTSGAAKDTTKKQEIKTLQKSDVKNMDRSQLMELKKIAMSMKTSVIQFSPDKTAVRTAGEKTEKFTWKTKKKDILLTKNLATMEKGKMQIIKLNSDTLQVEQFLKSGNLYFLYIKEK